MKANRKTSIDIDVENYNIRDPHNEYSWADERPKLPQWIVATMAVITTVGAIGFMAAVVSLMMLLGG